MIGGSDRQYLADLARLLTDRGFIVVVFVNPEILLLSANFWTITDGFTV